MYNLSKLKPQTRSFLDQISTNATNQKLIDFCIAKAICDELSIPSSPVNNQDDYYTQFCALVASQLISDVNEIRVMDIETIKQHIKRFWKIRYNIVFPRKRVFLITECDGDEHFFGFSQYMSKDFDEAIDNNVSNTVFTLNGFYDLISDIKTVTQGV